MKFNDVMPESTFADGVLHLGDCMKVLAAMEPMSVDLVYLDPPFFSQQKWKGKAGSFDDRWPDMSAFLDFMFPRVVQIHRVLKLEGAMYLHCDPNTAAAYLGVMCDDIFGGPEYWMTTICWRRTHAHSTRTKGLGRVHDSIHVYERTLGCHYLNEPSSDLWDDIYLGSMSNERVGYPTQKPVALAERIIGLSSKPGGVVLDPFCGSGTTLVAARNLGRRWIGVDQSADAIACAAGRMESHKIVPLVRQGQLDLLESA